jgi:hypothetical protein
MELSTYASGYKRLYLTDEEEVAACMGENARLRGGGIATIDPSNPRLHWWPSSLDFAAEAARSPPAVPVRDFRGLLDEIRRRNSLSTVFFYGHGADNELQFGSGQKLTMGEVSSLQHADVSARFLATGKMVFVACNAGQSQAFLQAIANALHVRIDGFPSGVEWNLTYIGLAPHRKITTRGLKDRAKTLNSARSFFPQR